MRANDCCGVLHSLGSEGLVVCEETSFDSPSFSSLGDVAVGFVGSSEAGPSPEGPGEYTLDGRVIAGGIGAGG